MGVSRKKLNKILFIGMGIVFIITVLLSFAGIPYYMTGHLVLPFIAGIVANNILNKDQPENENEMSEEEEENP